MHKQSKRAATVSLTAFIVSIVFFFSILILSSVTGVFALYALGWQILAVVMVWAVLVMQFYQRTLAEREQLDMAALEKAQGSDTIFQAQQSHADLFAVAQNRLRIFEKWFLPAFSLIIAGYQIVIGLFLLNKLKVADVTASTDSLLLGAVLAVAVAFISFLFSVFTTGMSNQSDWRPLRPGGSYLLATAVIAFVCAVAMALAQFKVVIVLSVINWVVPSVLVVIGAEAVLNFLLDIYRPRFKGKYSSAAFDSRILAVLASPGNILHTAAGAIDYQFGFKVSQTWFYKVMEKAIVPLVIFSIIVLYILSCVVIIAPEEQAVLERLGNPLDAEGHVQLLEPGLTFKLPWPFEIAYKFPTRQVQQINVGFVPDEQHGKQPLLWGKEHYKEEYNLLVASESKSSSQDGAVPVSIIRAAIPVQYKVVDLYKYLYNYQDSAGVLESVCYREVIKFVAGSRVEPESEQGNAEESLLGAGRAVAAEKLTKIIQARADEMDIGVEILFMGLQGFHPPPDVAEDFQAVIGAVQKKQAAILMASAERDALLTTNVGSVAAANKLYKLAQDFADTKYDGDTAKSQAAKVALDAEFAAASGELYAKLRNASGYAFERSVIAEAIGKRFAGQMQAFEAAKGIYTHELKMAMLEDALENIRKYIIVADGDTQVTVFDLQEKLVPSLYDIEPIQK